MIFNGRCALYCRKYASFGARHKNLNEDRPILSQKCRPMTLVSGGIWFMRIFAEVPRTGVVKRQWGCQLVENGNFQRFRWLFFRILYRWDQRYYMAIRSPSSAFQWSQNAWPWVILSSYFALNSFFRAGLAGSGSDRATSKNDCVKTNKGSHILSAVQIFGRVSGNIRFVQIFAWFL